MRVRDIIESIEKVAPKGFQDEWDNCGLQVGDPEMEVRKVLVCLDVTEEVVDEAMASGFQMIVSHHPLLFRGLKQVSNSTYQQRCVVKAIKNDIAIYSAHTSLDNAPHGVNFKIASILGLKDLRWLKAASSEDCGSGIVGELPHPEEDEKFFARVKESFKVECLLHSQCDGRMIRTVALCGGAGAFLMRDAAAAGADVFLSGEFHYHDYFETDGMLLCELGHYESEQYTQDLLIDLLSKDFPTLVLGKTTVNTNPIKYSR